MTPAEARAAFLWELVAPWDMYREIARLPLGERAEMTAIAAQRLGVSERTIQRRVARFWPAATEPQERGALHEIRCKGPNSDEGCSCSEVILAVL